MLISIFYFSATGKQRECINLGSFNYFGLNETSLDELDELSSALDEYGVAMCSPHFENGMFYSLLTKRFHKLTLFIAKKQKIL